MSGIKLLVMKLNRIIVLLITILCVTTAGAQDLSKAMRDSLNLRMKLTTRAIGNARSNNIKEARKHVKRLLFLADSLQQPMGDYYAQAGLVEDMAFNYERNKPAMGGKTNEKECLASAKQCYLYYQQAYEAYQQNPEAYNKKSLKSLMSLQSTAMGYYLLTKGFQVNARQSFAEKKLEQSLQEFLMCFNGSQSPFLIDVYKQDPVKMNGFATYMADSTQCRTLHNCATITTALNRLDESLVYYDSLKMRHYQPETIYRNTVGIYATLADTVAMRKELRAAIEEVPLDTWFQKTLLQIHIDFQEWDTAKVVADRIIEIDSTDVLVMNIVGQLHEIENHPFEALQIYQKSYELDSMQVDVCSHIGRIYYNRVVQTKEKLFNQRKTSQYVSKLTPLYDVAQEWYIRAYELDTEYKDPTIAQALREILYFSFTQTRCPNRAEQIALYNEISRNYGLNEFGK